MILIAADHCFYDCMSILAVLCLAQLHSGNFGVLYIFIYLLVSDIIIIILSTAREYIVYLKRRYGPKCDLDDQRLMRRDVQLADYC